MDRISCGKTIAVAGILLHAGAGMNLKTLAAHLGISSSTVSRVLAGRGDEFRIAKSTQARVLKEAATLGVRPDELARSLRLQTSHTIGLLIPDISNPFFASLARAVERQARQMGYSVLLADSQESVEEEQKSVRMLVDRRIDGLLLAPVGGCHDHLMDVVASGLPVVQVDRVMAELKTSSVVSDNFSGSREAVRHLVKLGHRRIACLQGREDSSVIAGRVRGYRAGLTDAGIRFSRGWLAGGEHSQQVAKVEGLKLLDLQPRPTAVLALSNLLALGMIEAARERGLEIPKDLSLLTFDEQPWASLLSPPLMTIAQPVEEMGSRAVEALVKQIGASRRTKAIHLSLPVRLVERGSVAPPLQG